MIALAIVAVARFALVIGNDTGDRDEPQLHYAETDADRFAQALVDLGGFDPGNVVELRGGDAEGARAALIALNERIRLAGAADSMLVVYYSGHADSEALHLGTSEFALPQLEQLVRGSPATFRLLVVDACRSGALTRVKGGHVAPAFPISLGDALAADGVVFWTASAASEQAQESDAVGGSFFSHFLVSGLAGPADADGDGSVTTAEAYEYARSATLRASSRTLTGTQHPTFRDELAGRDVIVLTRPGTVGPRRAQLRVPDGRDVLVLAGSADGATVAEVGAHDAVRHLNLRAGKYFIRERLETHMLEGTIELAAADDRAVEDHELHRVEYIQVAGKGGMHIRRETALAGLFMRTALVDGGEPCAGVIAGVAMDLGWITVTPRVSACREHTSNEFVQAATDDVAGDAAVSHAWRFGSLAFTAQVEAGGALLHQTFTTAGIAPARLSAAVYFGGGGNVALALAHGVTASIGTELDTFVLRRAEQMSSRWEPTLGLSAMVALGLAL